MYVFRVYFFVFYLLKYKEQFIIYSSTVTNNYKYLKYSIKYISYKFYLFVFLRFTIFLVIFGQQCFQHMCKETIHSQYPTRSVTFKSFPGLSYYMYRSVLVIHISEPRYLVIFIVNLFCKMFHSNSYF